MEMEGKGERESEKEGEKERWRKTGGRWRKSGGGREGERGLEGEGWEEGKRDKHLLVKEEVDRYSLLFHFEQRNEL